MSLEPVFCISEQVLCAYARSHGLSQTFLYSEQTGLDEDALRQHLKGSETVVLLLVASGSSFLWFDSAHHPMTCKLKSILTSKNCQVRMVVCPTTPADQRRCESREALSQALRQEFQVWSGFPEAVEVPGQRALVDLRAAEELHCEQEPPAALALAQQGEGRWFWCGVVVGALGVAIMGVAAFFWCRRFASEQKALKEEVKGLKELIMRQMEQQQVHHEQQREHQAQVLESQEKQRRQLALFSTTVTSVMKWSQGKIEEQGASINSLQAAMAVLQEVPLRWFFQTKAVRDV